VIDLSRNHLIEAGAGTGKTYALVQALLQALFQKGIPLTQIVALTFTKKAAGEMKERVADELRFIIKAGAMPERYQAWGHRLEEMQLLARGALEQIDRANISTIHSFAFTLLKRFPLAAGINPNSEIDEKGIRYGDFFDFEWPRFLSRELRENAPHAAEWLEILSSLRLEDVEALARLLSDFEVPLAALPISDANASARLKPLYETIRELAAAHASKDRAGRLVKACEEILGIAAAGEREKFNSLPLEVVQDCAVTPNKTKSWEADEWQALKLAQKVARNLLQNGDRIIALLSERVKPFVAHFRTTVLAEGVLSHNALLALACSLVRRDHEVRALLQREFRMILIDEFQDTDPRQGELLLFLAENAGGHAKNWRDVKLEPGKLFMVGDPKQSIYRFRGADISAYRQIADLVLAQGGIATPLMQSRRSHDQIIHVINHAFSQIIQDKPPISPPYVALESLRAREGLPLQDVELLLAGSAEPQSAQEAQEQEARSVAAWIAASVGQTECLDKKEGRRILLHRDIAIVFRSTPAMRAFVEALREREIPFVVEGERYFYSTPEVLDLVNFLRIIDNPSDRMALVGLLRSPLGGFTDLEIMKLKEAEALDLRRPLPPGFSEAHAHLWALLRRFHERVGREPLRALLGAMFEESFVLELAARAYHGDQTLANVLKLKRLLESFAAEGVTTLRALLSKVGSFMENDRLEGDSPLADETYDAVRLMTIHKAKGLEFPVVILPSLHSGRRSGQSDPIVFDWSSGRLGVRAGAVQNLEKFFLDAENVEREKEEEKRILYVAMTRARDRLILSGGINLLRPSSETYLEWLRNAWGLSWEAPMEGPMPIGLGEIRVRLAASTPAELRVISPASPVSRVHSIDPEAFAKKWRERSLAGQTALDRPAVMTPSSAASSENSGVPSGHFSALPNEGGLPSDGRLAGILVHRFLEAWDFNSDPSGISAALQKIVSFFFRSEETIEPIRAARIEAEANQLLKTFAVSTVYSHLAASKILAKELPFFYAAPESVLVRGSIDILYRDEKNVLTVGDYKTERIPSGVRLEDLAQRYSEQGRYYREAVGRSFGEPVRFQLFFLRGGVAVELHAG
jgi:ATP-dependent helicase/nuclease subunit A